MKVTTSHKFQISPFSFQLMVVSQTGHHSVNVQRPVVVVLNFVPGIVAIQVHSLVANLVTILALTKSRGNVTHSSVPVRKQTNKQFI